MYIILIDGGNIHTATVVMAGEQECDNKHSFNKATTEK